MDIAIVAPSPVPFAMGGAENLWLGLQRFINEETSHHCELFKVSTKESTLESVLASYEYFSTVNVDAFDHVITGKYPAWMVQHRSHAIYMLHPLRGLYDTYQLCNLPPKCDYRDDTIRKLRSQMAAILSGTGELADLFVNLKSILNDKKFAKTAALFPGPLAREVVHFLDSYALDPQRVSTYAAISKTVAQRANYFPPEARVDVLYPPPRLTGYQCAGDEYLFTTSRLDGAKRIGLLVEAMRHVKSNIQLLIGGTGPDEERLKTRAGDERRIIFLGYLKDAELLEYYANALAVPFVPYDEDYGLITIEAMMSGKPVLTTTDSGGVLEFVVNHETGLVVPADPAEIAKAIDYLCDHRQEAQAMGRLGRQRVAGITWEKVAEGLLGVSVRKPTGLAGTNKSATFKRLPPAQRRKMVVAVTFPVYPPRGGGQSRIYNLYREWARYYDITIVSLAAVSEQPFAGEIAPGLVEIRVPKSSAHQAIEDKYSAQVGWLPVTDIVAPRAVHETPDYLEKLSQACKIADVVVASHPYFASVLRQLAPEVPLWFEAQDVEYPLKKAILPQSGTAQKMLEWVKADEERAWREAEIVYACAKQDLADLEALYGPTKALAFEVANGFAADEVFFTGPEMKSDIKESLGLADQATVIFMGSWHGPNLEAVERIIQYAEALPAVTFLVVGSAGLKFIDQYHPENLKYLGVVNENEKQVLLSSADLAINPMTSGSGSNLKMFDYMASGVPVLTTGFGARGMDIEAGVHLIVAEIEDFIFSIMQFFTLTTLDERFAMCTRAEKLVSGKYSWKSIAQQAWHILEKP